MDSDVASAPAVTATLPVDPLQFTLIASAPKGNGAKPAGLTSGAEAKLAIAGGTPVRDRLLPYGHQSIDTADEAAVLATLRSDWLTQGPAVGRFETALAARCDARFAVAVSSGTAALHVACLGLGFGPGDEVITTPLTFVATVNAILYAGAKPVLADIDPATGNISVEAVRSLIGPRTRALLPVHYAGLPCRMPELRQIADHHGLAILEDACHALGASDNGRPIGAADSTAVFSFHPVKNATSAEGGAIVTNDPGLAVKFRSLRTHGVIRDGLDDAPGWYYEATDLGFNYRLSDLHAALGASQLGRIDSFLARRRRLVRRYQCAFQDLPQLISPTEPDGLASAWHLFVVRLRPDAWRVSRRAVYDALRAEGIGVQVHYIPVHFHPYHRDRLGFSAGAFPAAEEFYDTCLSLPLFAGMTERDQQDVIAAMHKVVAAYGT